MDSTRDPRPASPPPPAIVLQRGGDRPQRSDSVDGPARILQIGTSFFAAKTLLTAVEMGLFTALAKRPLTADGLARVLKLHSRAIPDFPDALVALGLLRRHGDGPQAVYMNTEETEIFLDRASPDYIGGILELLNARGYRYWADLTEALRSGKPQNEIKNSGKSMFQTLYERPERLEQFLNAMAGASLANFRKLATAFDFSSYGSLCDVGGASGQLACLVAAAQPHLKCVTFDLPKVTEIAQRRIREEALSDRVTAVAGDFFAEPLPRADVITMGMVLHDWDLAGKKQLIAKAYDALPEGGAFIAIETLIDDARRENAAGLLMSLNMLIEFGDAFDFSGADFETWCREAGFRNFAVLPLEGPSSAAIAYK